VHYTCDDFFNCRDHASNVVGETVDLVSPHVAIELLFGPSDRLRGNMLIDRVTPHELPDLLRGTLTRMYLDVEAFIRKELAEGCSIRPHRPPLSRSA
jgi:hypothetical protein